MNSIKYDVHQNAILQHQTGLDVKIGAFSEPSVVVHLQTVDEYVGHCATGVELNFSITLIDLLYANSKELQVCQGGCIALI